MDKVAAFSPRRADHAARAAFPRQPADGTLCVERDLHTAFAIVLPWGFGLSDAMAVGWFAGMVGAAEL